MNAPTPQPRPDNAPGRSTPLRPSPIYREGAVGRSSVKDVDFILKLRAIPGNGRTTPVLRLRALLKRALRDYGLRCDSISNTQSGNGYNSDDRHPT
jgi:hypothetical protein